MRAMWRWVTCAISCASTDASSDSEAEETISPVFTPMKPPGSAKALIEPSRMAKKSNAWRTSGATATSRPPSRLRYSVTSASST